MTFLKRAVPFVVVCIVCFSMLIGFSVPASAASVSYSFDVEGVPGYRIPDSVSDYPVHILFKVKNIDAVYLASCPASDVKVGFYDNYSSWPSESHSYTLGLYENPSSAALSCFKLFPDGSFSSASLPYSSDFYNFSIIYTTVEIRSSYKSGAVPSYLVYGPKPFPSPTFSLSISEIIDSPVLKDSKSRFSSLEVTFSGAIVSYEDGSEFEYTYSGDMAFNGFALADDGPVVYAVGNTYDLSDVDGLSLFVKTRNRTWSTFFPDLAAIAGSFMVQVRNVANSISSNPLLLLCSGFLFLGGCIGIFVRLSSRN